MPVRTIESSPGHRVFEFTCECGAPGRCSIGCNLRLALKTGDVKFAGTWFCSYSNGEPVCARRVG